LFSQFKEFMKNIFVIAILFICRIAFAQNFPATDLYLMDIKLDKGQYVIGSPKKITDWKGYDNQPSFLPDGSAILYTSVRENGKADIYSYNLAQDRTQIEINTPTTSEYSPQLTPDHLSISCVRVMEDDTTQLLYKFTIKDDNPIVLFPKIQPVGYY